MHPTVETVAELHCCECGKCHTWRLLHRPGARRPWRAQLRTGRRVVEQYKTDTREAAELYIVCALIEDGAEPFGVGASARREAGAAMTRR